MKVDERYLWALGKLALAPGDRVLEVGFGAGILLDLMASHASGIDITGVDGSRAVVGNARLRRVVQNTPGVRIINAHLLQADLEAKAYSKIVAFNVPFFRVATAPELPVLKHLLADTGMLYVFYQNPGSVSEYDISRIANNLLQNGFEVLDSGFGPKAGKQCLFVISRAMATGCC